MPTIKTKKLFLFLFIRYHKNFEKNVFKIQTQENTAKATVYINIFHVRVTTSNL